MSNDTTTSSPKELSPRSKELLKDWLDIGNWEKDMSLAKMIAKYRVSKARIFQIKDTTLRQLGLENLSKSELRHVLEKSEL